MSQLSQFAAGAPIRGGIPIVFPWFGPREGMPTHGFARQQDWELREIAQRPGGAVALRLGLPDSPEAALLPKFSVELVVTFGDTLQAELIVTNTSPADELTFESCFHTYFDVGDIHSASIAGLKGVDYIDRCDKLARKTEQCDQIKITQEVDRLYPNTTGTTEILDPTLKRRIRIEKAGSLSTVVWNPWIAKSQRMPDFGDEEYLKMLCVESGNVDDDSVTLAPGKSSCLKIELSELPL
jgi:D-hexose-6-phosphate mutarotase